MAMFDMEKMRCDYFCLYPCDCGEHYSLTPFNEKEKFLEFVDFTCSHLLTETITEKFPLICGIGTGQDLEDYYIYNFHAKDAKQKPFKVKWIGVGSLHALFAKEDSKERIPVVVKKEIKCIKSKDVTSFLDKCLQATGVR